MRQLMATVKPLIVSAISALTVALMPLTVVEAGDSNVAPPVPLASRFPVASIFTLPVAVILVSPVEVVSMLAPDSSQPILMPSFSMAI